ncbi:MAG: YtxH domain-containing protein [Bryobacteraceae bacterium]
MGLAEKLTWFAIGVGVGSGTALLFSPRSGGENRGLIREKTKDAKDYIADKIQDGKESVRDLAQKAKDSAPDAGRIKDKLSDAGEEVQKAAE